jgi:hypothetical protein
MEMHPLLPLANPWQHIYFGAFSSSLPSPRVRVSAQPQVYCTLDGRSASPDLGTSLVYFGASPSIVYVLARHFSGLGYVNHIHGVPTNSVHRVLSRVWICFDKLAVITHH